MNEQRHVLVFPVSLWKGMAGTRRVRVLVDELATKGNYTFSNLIIDHPAEYGGQPQTGQEDAMPYCRIGYRYRNPLTWLAFWWAGSRFISRMRRGYGQNFVYCYQETDLLTLPLLLAARALGYKILVDVVEDNALLRKSFTNGLARLRVRSEVWLLNRLPVYADAAIAISTYLYEKTRRIANGRIPVALIPVSVNLRAYDRAPRDLPPPAQHPAPSHRAAGSGPPFRVFYGGSFGSKDGLDHLLQAIDLCRPFHPNLRLVLTGTGSATDMDRFRQWVSALKLEPSIDYRGYLPDAAYLSTLQSCDAFCMTRTKSAFANAGFPFKLGEMLATGKPVIATRVGDVEAYLADFDNALLVEPEQPEQIASRLSWLMTHYPQAMAVGTRGKRVAEQHFSVSRIAGQLDLVFTELTQTT